MRGNPRYLFAVAIICALLVLPSMAAADSLTGSVAISWLRPTVSSITNADTILVGSSISCPGTSQICSGYNPTTSETFSVGSSSITYNASGYVPITSLYPTSTFNGFDFSNLTFASGGTLVGFTLTTNMAGLTSSDVSFTGSSIEINLAGVPEDGTFTLGLVSSNSGSVPAPEPKTLTLLGAGLIALFFLAMRQH